ncbi:MAG: tRNA-dihydrouridine synthase, partial [Myxococcales bacterium]|nr:tRNA-dihydrouridine synthase [Myxococcales bacterium]
MMDRTDRHFRFVMRQITRHTLLYTEMITTGAVIHGDRSRLLGFDTVEHPIAVQLGGDDPVALADGLDHRELGGTGEQRHGAAQRDGSREPGGG